MAKLQKCFSKVTQTNPFNTNVLFLKVILIYVKFFQNQPICTENDVFVYKNLFLDFIFIFKKILKNFWST